MTSTIFTRRAMLSSGTLVGIGALLAACGQQANNEAAAASATPSTVRGYSGQSKAPRRRIPPG